MKTSNTLIKEDFPVAMYKGRAILRENEEAFDDIIKDAKSQIDAEIEAEIRAVVEKVLSERGVNMSYKHSIIYKPTCGSCGAVIHGTVSSRSWQYKCASGRGVWPTSCPNCGTYFYSIVMPNPPKQDFEIDMDIDYTNVRGGQNENEI